MKSILRLGSFVKPYLPQIVLSMLGLTVLTGLSLVVPRIMQQVIDEGITRRELTYLVHAAFLLLGLGLLTAVLGGFQRYISEWIGSQIGYDIRNRLYDHIQQLSFSYHDHSQTGQLISRCIEDVRSVQQFIGSSIVELTQLLLLLFGALGIMLTENWQLTLIAVLPIFLVDVQVRPARDHPVLPRRHPAWRLVGAFAGECHWRAGGACLCARTL
jgi:ABC-type multidrug transport system fused ATPase/permease subunit